MSLSNKAALCLQDQNALVMLQRRGRVVKIFLFIYFFHFAIEAVNILRKNIHRVGDLHKLSTLNLVVKLFFFLKKKLAITHSCWVSCALIWVFVSWAKLAFLFNKQLLKLIKRCYGSPDEIFRQNPTAVILYWD